LIDAFKTDPRLKKLNAIVFLMLKPKGRGITFKLLPLNKYKKIVDYALERKINIGFDSCSAFTFLKTVDDPKQYEDFVEECESSRFSLYINVQGKYHHCSFAENGQGLDVANCTDFLKDIWYNDNVVKFRNKALENVNNKISCQLYDLNIK
jgi:MoaA/NifB/PqqE/SkfB family radical SAM enzyme